MELLTRFSAWLRALSLSGGSGNAAAWAIVLGLSLLPALGLLWRGRQRADWLLLLAGLETFAGLYYLVNPTLMFYIPEVFDGGGLAAVWGLAAAGCVLSTLAVWAMLRLLKLLEAAPAKLFPRLLRAGAALYLVLAAIATVQRTLAAIRELAEMNTTSGTPGLAGALLWVLALVELVPYGLGAWVLLLGGRLAEAMEAAPFAAETVELAETVARRCAGAARASLLVTAGCNLLRLLSASVVTAIRIDLYLPLTTLALCAALLMLCRYLRRAKAVSDDNESII